MIFLEQIIQFQKKQNFYSSKLQKLQIRKIVMKIIQQFHSNRIQILETNHWEEIKQHKKRIKKKTKRLENRIYKITTTIKHKILIAKISMPQIVLLKMVRMGSSLKVFRTSKIINLLQMDTQKAQLQTEK